MKEFKGYQSGNEKRVLTLDMLYAFFDITNKHNHGDGDLLEEEILNKHNAVTLSDLSTSTLIHAYDEIMQGD